MTADRVQRVKELLEEALARRPEERASLLAAACGDDGELQAEVESLLEHHEQASTDFMQPPEPDPQLRQRSAADRPDPRIGAKIGGYHIKGVIAAGGMGTVYEAVQKEPHRVVALKVMHRNVASRSALRRFQFESQVLARLRHPNVAQVFEAGTARVGGEEDRPGDGPARSVPYFAMEYIPGAKNLVQYAKEKRLGMRDRLRLFAKVCDAVHHGHQKGIIHRDLKPANILVDSGGEPKVIDFGVARATDSDLAITTQQTVIGQLIGTMQYMSPEQCDADPHDLDTRSDVYSLGVVLYELLTGELPYEVSSTTIYQATQVIKEHVPRRLSAMNPKLRGDVETIALKALEKDRDRRYQSAADLAQDIRRYLNSEPIEARPPTVWTWAVRWLVRHPVIATNTIWLTVVALSIVGLIASVRAFNTRPHRITLDKDGSEAALLTFAGGILQKWIAEPPGEIRFAELVKRPAEFGGGQLALLGFTGSCGEPFRGSLCVFDAEGDLEEPIWKRRIESKDILPELVAKRGSVAEEYSVQAAWVFDVFPERLGKEIGVCYARSFYSQRVLRIYDLSGELLYEVWHDGAVGTPYWMADAGLLVVAGDDHAPYWDKYGKLLGEKVCDRVVFALRPALGHTKDTNYLNDADRLSLGPADNPGGPVWYMRLWPEDALDSVESIRLWPPDPPNDPGRCVTFEVLVGDQPQATVWWVINEDGNEVQGTRNWGDDYKSNRRQFSEGDDRRLSDPEQFELGATAIEGDNASRRP